MTENATGISQISVEALTTFDVDPNGKFVRLHLRDNVGQPATVVLPTDCLNQLLMSMPRMLQKATQNHHQDESLRLVFPLRKFDVERGQVNLDGMQQYILTLTTADGFSVSFAATEPQLVSMGEVFIDGVVHAKPLPISAIRYS